MLQTLFDIAPFMIQIINLIDEATLLLYPLYPDQNKDHQAYYICNIVIYIVNLKN